MNLGRLPRAFGLSFFMAVLMGAMSYGETPLSEHSRRISKRPAPGLDELKAMVKPTFRDLILSQGNSHDSYALLWPKKLHYHVEIQRWDEKALADQIRLHGTTSITGVREIFAAMQGFEEYVGIETKLVSKTRDGGKGLRLHVDILLVEDWKVLEGQYKPRVQQWQRAFSSKDQSLNITRALDRNQTKCLSAIKDVSYEAIARDLSCDYTETSIAGMNLFYRCG